MNVVIHTTTRDHYLDGLNQNLATFLSIVHLVLLFSILGIFFQNDISYPLLRINLQ
jgi:hypothetical protein